MKVPLLIVSRSRIEYWNMWDWRSIQVLQNFNIIHRDKLWIYQWNTRSLKQELIKDGVHLLSIDVYQSCVDKCKIIFKNFRHMKLIIRRISCMWMLKQGFIKSWKELEIFNDVIIHKYIFDICQIIKQFNLYKVRKILFNYNKFHWQWQI